MLKKNGLLEYKINCDESEYDALLAEKKAKIAEFSYDFGEIPEFPEDYGIPRIMPTVGEHPRLWVKKKNLEQIIENLQSEENRSNYNKVMDKADVHFDGILPDPCEHTYNYDPKFVAKIESLAFMYLVTGDELFGYSAILAVKNYLTTIIITDEFHDKRYYAGASMYVFSEVYDWCYSLLTEKDKEAIVKGCVNVLSTLFEIGVPPAGQGAVCGHGTGAQLLRNWLAFSIATFDEFPSIYKNVVGRFFQQYIDAPNFYYPSGTNFQGSSYGVGKTILNILSELLVHNMSGDYLYSFSFEPVVRTFINYLRPDGEQIRIGDDYKQHAKGKSNVAAYGSLAFYGASLYDNSVFKAWALDLTNDFNGLGWAGEMQLTPVTFLILNKPWIKRGDKFSLPTVNYNGSPTGAIIARSKWGDENAWMTYTKIGEAYGGNHEHKDAGSFQIYYKGILAMTSSCYEYYYRDNYGTLLDFAYGKQSISKNCLLIFNHEFPTAKTPWEYKWVNSGGQRFRGDVNGEPPTLDVWLQRSTSHQAKVLGHSYALENGYPAYAYISGDLTNAYDDITVDNVVRSTITMSTGHKEHPMVFMVYDRITAKKPLYKKTFLLHTPEEPKIDGKYVTVTNTERGNNGKLVNCTLLPEAINTSVIGGDGKRFFVEWHNVAEEHKPGDPDWDRQEIGWGRVEICPKEHNLTDNFLNVMYVGDADKDEAYIESKLIRTNTHEGACCLGTLALFSKTNEPSSDDVEFTVDKITNCHVTGLAEGEWQIYENGVKTMTRNVTAESTVAIFSARAGSVKLTLCK